MSVVCGQGGSDLVVGDDGQIDEKAKDSGAEEVPKSHRSEKHHSPVVRERCRRLRFLDGPQLQKAPRFYRQESKGYDLRRRKESSERHGERRFAGEIHMMHGTYDAAR